MSNESGFEDPLPADSRSASVPGTRAVVIGAGIAGLVAARELAHAGMAVTVIEASGQVGGAVAAHEVGGLVLDAGAESYATRSPVFAELAEALGLGEQLTEPNPAGAWLYHPEIKNPDHAVPLPKQALLGIPGDLDEPSLREVLGGPGLLRAKLDMNLPKGVGAKAASLADLVRARMGQTVLDRLVAPIAGGVYSVSPEELDPEAVIPGIRASIREHGSLSAAIRAMRGPGVRPGSAVGGVRGGVFQIARALRTELEDLGVEILLDTPVEGVHLEPQEQQAGHAGGKDTKNNPVGRGAAETWRVSTALAQLPAERLVIAADAVSAVQLLTPHLAEAEEFADIAEQRRELTLVTLLVDMPELDAAPRGTGVLIAAQEATIRAKALTHSTVKWSWLAEEEGPGTHVLRLSYPERDAASVPQALADASTVLGLEITEQDVVDADQLTWASAVSPALLGQRAKLAELRAAVSASHPGRLAVTGAWLAGNGLAAVIADAQGQARKLV
ncbi:protoporphyrinogen/coproporphyrinogen oxidase [Acaricomes phytoseiuli]|uniref:protoporphyrinogen/coproporphyrinogen oxidase n=1 Tax=Acaricomes phytoseiuli TaxID=291968 RepID=UPI00036DAF63|nr:FAD-dependent oxidoreductase [Acaricomes phytoseiuli]